MIEINPRYETIFDARNLDADCDKIARLMRSEADLIKEAMGAGLYKQAVTMYLQLLKSMCDHFVKDEHYCHFDDMYSPEYVLRLIYDEIREYNIAEDIQTLIADGHSEIMYSECYQQYGYPSYI